VFDLEDFMKTYIHLAILVALLILVALCIPQWFDRNQTRKQVPILIEYDDKTVYTHADEEWITVSSPLPGDSLTSPLVIKGQARGSWFFEGSAPVMLVDWDGRIIAQKYVMTTEDWMTSDLVSFEGVLDFSLEPENRVYPRGTLILQNDNPSGFPEQDRSIEIPVRF